MNASLSDGFSSMCVTVDGRRSGRCRRPLPTWTLSAVVIVDNRQSPPRPGHHGASSSSAVLFVSRSSSLHFTSWADLRLLEHSFRLAQHRWTTNYNRGTPWSVHCLVYGCCCSLRRGTTPMRLSFVSCWADGFGVGDRPRHDLLVVTPAVSAHYLQITAVSRLSQQKDRCSLNYSKSRNVKREA